LKEVSISLSPIFLS